MAIEYIRLNKDQPAVLGSDVRCVSGKVVSTRVSSPTQDLEVYYRFQWASWTEVQSLYSSMLAGTAVTILSQSVIIAVDGISDVKHQGFGDEFDPSDFTGQDTDLWTGRIKGYIKA